jgi:hypothetical protein
LIKLANLHLDHSFEVQDICKAWIEAMPRRKLRSWDDGVNGELICHLLVGVTDHPNFSTTRDNKWRAAVRFRCGESRTCSTGSFCHDTRYKHYGFKITGDDVKR